MEKRDDGDKNFRYIYTAPTPRERREIEGIRRQYAPEPDSPGIEKLRALDKKARRSPTAAALVLGVGGCLIFGLGMAMVLEWSLTAFGSAVSVFGAVAAVLAYPVYGRLLKRGKLKYGDRIVKLSEEILEEKKDESRVLERERRP